MKVLIVGNEGGTNVGASMKRSALADGLDCRLCDSREATMGPRIAVTLSWRLLGHKPLYLESFSRSVVEECKRDRPDTLVATGLAPLNAKALAEIGRMGVRRVNYSTDDPWNPVHRSAWFLDAAREYDEIYTTRESNLEDFGRHGCKKVEWLPFGYDAGLWADANDVPVDGDADVFFAGAAESYRVECVRALVAAGVKVAVAGQYWTRFPDLRRYRTGHLAPAAMKAWTRKAKIALCLMRRANRDGHVMRSYEIPAIGACMVAEETAEHRRIFGEDGATVRYFRSPAEAVSVVEELLQSREEAARLEKAARTLITGSPNTYGDRLKAMLPPVPCEMVKSQLVKK